MIKEKLKEIGITLPIPPKPAGSYIPVVTTGNLAYISGQIPIKDGKIVFSGRVPVEQSIESAQEAAKLCMINCLSQLNSYFGSLECITKIIKISGFINSSSDFSEHPKIINTCLLYTSPSPRD